MNNEDESNVEPEEIAVKVGMFCASYWYLIFYSLGVIEKKLPLLNDNPFSDCSERDLNFLSNYVKYMFAIFLREIPLYYARIALEAYNICLSTYSTLPKVAINDFFRCLGLTYVPSQNNNTIID